MMKYLIEDVRIQSTVVLYIIGDTCEQESLSELALFGV
jgi:hypothetical protein